MATNYSQADDDSGVDINEPIQMDDISGQETTDVLEPARRVPLEIKAAKIRTRYDDENDKSGGYVKRLSLQVAVGADGVDGEGTSANRRLFPEYVIAFSSGDGVRDSDWWKKKARGPVKELFAALGIELNPPPPIDQDFLDSLVSREFRADIKRKPIQKKTDEINPKTNKPVYKDTGDFQNELENHRAV
jgi:hypothetical protein